MAMRDPIVDLDHVSSIAPVLYEETRSEMYRQMRVLSLRVRGHSMAGIAQELGLPGYAVQALLRKALLTFPAHDLEEWRALENDRLDAALNAIWDKVQAGNTEAIKVMIEIMKRRAFLNGFDAPQQINVRYELENYARVRAEALGLPPEDALEIAAKLIKSG